MQYTKVRHCWLRWLLETKKRHNILILTTFNELKREEFWTQNITTGSRTFVEAIKKQMHRFAIGRRVRKKTESFELRESQSSYKALFGTEKIDIEIKNQWLWNEKKLLEC